MWIPFRVPNVCILLCAKLQFFHYCGLQWSLKLGNVKMPSFSSTKLLWLFSLSTYFSNQIVSLYKSIKELQLKRQWISLSNWVKVTVSLSQEHNTCFHYRNLIHYSATVFCSCQCEIFYMFWWYTSWVFDMGFTLLLNCLTCYLESVFLIDLYYMWTQS